MSAAPFVSPMKPVAPPAKKMKGGMDVSGVESVKSRRQQLDLLKQKQQQRTGQPRIGGHLRAHSPARGPPPGGPPPPGAPVDRVRHSDIFPTVETKVSAARGAPPMRNRAPPPPKSRPEPPSTPASAVARRLDQSFDVGSGKSPAPPPAMRPKSAPPVRPSPPPGPPPVPHKEAPDSTPTSSRSFAPRPPPMTPGSIKVVPAAAKIEPEPKPPTKNETTNNSNLKQPPSPIPPTAPPIKMDAGSAPALLPGGGPPMLPGGGPSVLPGGGPPMAGSSAPVLPGGGPPLLPGGGPPVPENTAPPLLPGGGPPVLPGGGPPVSENSAPPLLPGGNAPPMQAQAPPTVLGGPPKSDPSPAPAPFPIGVAPPSPGIGSVPPIPSSPIPSSDAPPVLSSEAPPSTVPPLGGPATASIPNSSAPPISESGGPPILAGSVPPLSLGPTPVPAPLAPHMNVMQVQPPLNLPEAEVPDPEGPPQKSLLFVGTSEEGEFGHQPEQTSNLLEMPRMVEEPPKQSRKTLIRNLHEYAETPAKKAPDVTEASGLLRLEKEVREHEMAKAEALRRVAELEAEVQQLKERENNHAMLPVGMTPKSSTPQVGFFSPLSPGGLGTPGAKSLRKRISTPYPKHRLQEQQTPGNLPGKNEKDLYAEAVSYTPFEFTTDLATFVVRRPYGLATERELWFQAGNLNSKQYEKSADVNNPESLEIVAQISADGSMLAIHDSAFARHISADADADWKEFGNVYDLDQPLGSITYIDGDANEKEYSLDDVFRGAESSRENFCTSVVSMVVGLKAKGTKGKDAGLNGFPNKAALVVPPVAEKKKTAEIGVGTEDISFPAEEKKEENPQPQQQQQAPPPPPAFDDDEGSDTFSILFGTFGSLLFWILKTIFFTIPLRIITSFLGFILFWIAYNLISLQFADNERAAPYGPQGTLHNRPGII